MLVVHMESLEEQETKEAKSTSYSGLSRLCRHRHIVPVAEKATTHVNKSCK